MKVGLDMSQPAKRRQPDAEPVRVLGRGLGAQKGVHLTLRTLREASAKTQVEVSELSQINQADVSRLENRKDFDDCQVATLKRFIAALGGELQLVAKFGDKRIVIDGVQPAPATAPVAKAQKRSSKS
jgi:predicted XRE-type DNA-binding protein